jgi:hypothetical protein
MLRPKCVRSRNRALDSVFQGPLGAVGFSDGLTYWPRAVDFSLSSRRSAAWLDGKEEPSGYQSQQEMNAQCSGRVRTRETASRAERSCRLREVSATGLRIDGDNASFTE